jgi:hypothetical protein
MDDRYRQPLLSAFLVSALSGCWAEIGLEGAPEVEQTVGGEDTGALEDLAPDVGVPEIIDRGPRRATLTHSFGVRIVRPFGESIPCVSWTLNNDQPLYVEAVTMVNNGGFHHSNWFVVPDDTFPGEDGYWRCSDRGFNEISAAVLGTVLFAQSTQSQHEVQRIGEGVTIKIPPHHTVVSDVHLLNLAPFTLESELRMSLEIVHPADVEIVVTPFRLTYFDLDIPPESESRFQSDCSMATAFSSASGHEFDMQLYWVLPHMHGLGSYFEVSINGGPRDGETLYEFEGFNADSNGQAFDPPIDLTGASGLSFTCGFTNPTSEPVGWGIGDQEMCVMLGFADMDVLLDSIVDEDSRVIDETDGMVLNTGPCQIIALPKNINQAYPTVEEIEGDLYIPFSDAPEDTVEPIFSCDDADEEAEPTIAPTLASLRAGIFRVGCSFNACHGGPVGQAGLNLEAEDLYTELITHPVEAGTDLQLIEPGDPERSWLYQRISNCEPTDASGEVVPNMPFNSPVLLKDGLIAAVREWIAAGAHDN